MSALDEALQLAEAGRDPVAAMKNHDKVVSLLRRARAESRTAPHAASGDHRLELEHGNAHHPRVHRAETLAELGATKIVRLDQITPIAPGGSLDQLRLEWPGGDGFARSMFASTTDGARTSLARVSVRITINGADDLFTTGLAPTFVPLTVFNPGTHLWFRLAGPAGEREGYPVSALTKWSISFRYEGPPAPVGAITPVLLFGYVRKRT